MVYVPLLLLLLLLCARVHLASKCVAVDACGYGAGLQWLQLLMKQRRRLAQHRQFCWASVKGLVSR
jgi:hypothetical protein